VDHSITHNILLRIVDTVTFPQTSLHPTHPLYTNTIMLFYRRIFFDISCIHVLLLMWLLLQYSDISHYFTLATQSIHKHPILYYNNTRLTIDLYYLFNDIKSHSGDKSLATATPSPSNQPHIDASPMHTTLHSEPAILPDNCRSNALLDYKCIPWFYIPISAINTSIHPLPDPANLTPHTNISITSHSNHPYLSHSHSPPSP
jgi:hypothetical protein